MNRTEIKMTGNRMIETWPVNHTEQPISTPETGRFDASGVVGLPVTEQEEEAWLEKMQQLAGCVA
jgi:hypothetical protein